LRSGSWDGFKERTLKKVTSNAKDGILRNAIVTVPTLPSFFPEKRLLEPTKEERKTNLKEEE
jgi:hypothetical protein